MARDYGTGPSAADIPRQPPVYLPGAASDGGGMPGFFGPTRDPEAAGPPKSIRRQDLGSVVGRRGAGVSQITGGDQGAHSIGHYGKKAKPGGGPLGGLIGGTL
jgi:hypothetical protein